MGRVLLFLEQMFILQVAKGRDVPSVYFWEIQNLKATIMTVKLVRAFVQVLSSVFC